MRSRILVAALTLATLQPVNGRAIGKYTLRQRARGEITDTSARLDRWAFINDEKATDQGLVLVVDTFVARSPADERVMPLVIALSYEGEGEAIPIRPDRFRLSWGDGPPVEALEQSELAAHAGGRSPVYADTRMLSFRSPLAFDTPNAERVGVRFHSHPGLRGLVHDRLALPSHRWFATLAYFPLPAGFARWDALFELQYVPVDGEPPAVTCRFRVQRSLAVQAKAMHRAKKEVRRESRKR